MRTHSGRESSRWRRDAFFGGDSWYYCVGDYNLAGRQLSVNLSVTHDAHDAHSICGSMREFTVALKNALDESKVNLKGQANQGND